MPYIEMEFFFDGVDSINLACCSGPDLMSGMKLSLVLNLNWIDPKIYIKATLKTKENKRDWKRYK